MAEYQRQTAKKCRIGHLLDGNYVQQEGWDPSYVETEVGKVSRVNIMAVVVGRDGDNLIIDDGSGKISLRSFGEVPLENFEVGDKVLIIGRPRTYNEELYLAAEAVKEIKNDKWLDYRKLEIDLLPKVEVEEKQEQAEVVEEDVSEKQEQAEERVEGGQEIIQKIKELDEGNGAEVDDVIEGVDNGERIMNNLMEEGEVFEIKPGKVKVLE